MLNWAPLRSHGTQVEINAIYSVDGEIFWPELDFPPDGSVMHVMISQRLVLWGLCTASGSSGDEWATAWVPAVAC